MIRVLKSGAFETSKNCRLFLIILNQFKFWINRFNKLGESFHWALKMQKSKARTSFGASILTARSNEAFRSEASCSTLSLLRFVGAIQTIMTSWLQFSSCRASEVWIDLVFMFTFHEKWFVPKLKTLQALSEAHIGNYYL